MLHSTQHENTIERRGSMAYELKKFKGWMVENGIKQADIASLIGISPTNINLKLNGNQNITLDDVRKICETYGISADLFLP